LFGSFRGEISSNPKPIAIEMKRGVHVVDPQHDLGETGDPAHAAIAVTIAARFASLARVGTEQPGASSNATARVSSTALSGFGFDFRRWAIKQARALPSPPMDWPPLIFPAFCQGGLPWLGPTS